jgi:hypothetical protein
MKPPQARRPHEPISKGEIADRQTARSLVSGSGYLNPEAPHQRRRCGSLQAPILASVQEVIPLAAVQRVVA